MHATTPNPSKRPNAHLYLMAFGLLALLFVGPACEDPVVEQPQSAAGPKGDRNAKGKKNQKSRRRGGNANKKTVQLKQNDANWTPTHNWERRTTEDRDPFVGFVDEILAEQERQRAESQAQDLDTEELLLPAQRFDVRDFRLVAVITNTATPKALLLDGRNQPHRLKKGDLIGNRNGVLVDIRRNEIEILQGEDLVNAPERVVMKLHPEPAGIQFDIE